MRKLLAIAASAAALCASAVDWKPGYRYHREVLPSDRVPVDMELVMSNYLHDAGYVPSHVTNTETVVYNVTNNFIVVHDVTNNFYEVREFTNVFHQVTNILTRETVEITNNVTRNFYTEHWYTNNLYEVRELTNVVHEVNEITNNITQVFSNEYRNVVYETTNRTEYVTNNVTDEIWHTVVYSNVYENVISNRWIYDHRETHVTNNLVTWATNVLTEVREFTNNFTDVFWYTNNLVTWATNVLTEVREFTNNFTDVFWYTNNVTLNVTNNFYEEHWHTNNIHTVETNEFYHETYNTVVITNSIVVPVTNNFYNETWITNNIVLDRTNNIHTVTFSNVYWTVHEDFYHTNYETRIVAETNYTHEVHTNVEEYYIFTTEEITNKVVQLREITNVYVQSNVTENVFNTITNNYSNWYTDRISFTNGTERHEIDALNKRYMAYRRVVERYDGPYWTSDKFSHVFGTNQVPLFKSGGDVAFATFDMLSVGDGEDSCDSLDVKSSDIHLTGYVVPLLDFLDADSYSEQQGYACWPVLLGFKVAGGYYGITAGTTNYVTATTVPGIGDYLIGGYTIFGANYVYTDNPVLTFKGPEYTVFHYCLREDGTLRWIPGAEPDGKAMTLTSGKTGAAVSSSEHSHTTYTRHDGGGIDVVTTNWTHYVSELADFNDLLHYGSIWTAEDVVTNRVFVETMEDAMYPYTFASYTNMVQAAGYARQTATDAKTVTDYMETADQKISAAISTATADAIDAKNLAQSYASTARAAQNNANNAASQAQTAQAKAEFAYDLIQTFTNWFYEAVESGGVVTNVHVYNPVYKIETEDYVMDLHNMSVHVMGGTSFVMQVHNTYGSWLEGVKCTGVGEADPGGLSVKYGDGNQYMSSYGKYKSRLVSLHWSLDGFWNAVVNTTTTRGESFMTTYRAEGRACLPTDSTLRLEYYAGQEVTQYIAVPHYIGVRRERSSQSVNEMTKVAHYLVNNDVENMIAAEALARSQADEAEALARSQADEAEAGARAMVVPNLMSDITSILVSGDTECHYDVYFDMDGQVQGTFVMRTGDYTTSEGVRTYRITNIRGGPATSTSHGQLSSVAYTWNPSTGALSVKLTGSYGRSRTYTTTQNNPIVNYYGAQWSCLNTSQVPYDSGNWTINTTGKTYLNPLVKLMKAAAGTNTTFIIAQ